jgi:pyridoxine/pyridoxamine 5'-phosphate oxidase
VHASLHWYHRAVTPAELVSFMRAQPWAVEASVDASGSPQAAVIGVAVTDDLELVFDTVNTTRKCANLRRDPRIALVIGWDDAQTVQYEGIADEPTPEELEERLLPIYLARFPDGAERRSWPDITYFRVRPRWIRYSDFSGETPRLVERRFDSSPSDRG